MSSTLVTVTLLVLAALLAYIWRQPYKVEEKNNDHLSFIKENAYDEKLKTNNFHQVKVNKPRSQFKLLDCNKKPTNLIEIDTDDWNEYEFKEEEEES